MAGVCVYGFVRCGHWRISSALYARYVGNGEVICCFIIITQVIVGMRSL